MAEEKTELGEILARLENVERQNRHLKRGGIVGALLLAMVFIMGQAKSSRIVEAEAFVLKDLSGNSRARWGMAGGNPALTLTDAKGQTQVLLQGGDRPVISVSRTGGKEQVTLTATEDMYGLAIYGEPKGISNGTQIGLGVWKGIPGLTLYDEKGIERVGLDLKQSGPTLRLVDGESKAGFNMWVAPLGGGPDFSMYDAKGELRVDLVAPDGGPSLKLEDQNGYSAILGSTDLLTPSTGRKEMTSAASLTLFGKDKKVLWSAP
jgi:hypothetical protein